MAAKHRPAKPYRITSRRRPTILEAGIKTILGARGAWRRLRRYKNHNTANVAKHRASVQAAAYRRQTGRRVEFKAEGPHLYGRVARG